MIRETIIKVRTPLSSHFCDIMDVENREMSLSAKAVGKIKELSRRKDFSFDFIDTLFFLSILRAGNNSFSYTIEPIQNRRKGSIMRKTTDIPTDIGRTGSPHFVLLERKRGCFFWNFQKRNTLPFREEKSIFLFNGKESPP
jgi:hypothetical protein